MRNTPTSANHFRFTGEQQDLDARRDLLYLRARHYDPTLGRFLQRDPVPTLQRYPYVQNNPTRLADPSGLSPIDMTTTEFGVYFGMLAFYMQQLIACSQGNNPTCMSEILAVQRAEWLLTGVVGGARSAAGGSWDAVKTAAEYANQSSTEPRVTISQERRQHILYGEGGGAGGGGHKCGEPKPQPNTTQFPRDWDDDRIISEIEDVANGPNLRADPHDQYAFEGTTSGGWDIRIIIDIFGGIVTGYPKDDQCK